LGAKAGDGAAEDGAGGGPKLRLAIYDGAELTREKPKPWDGSTKTTNPKVPLGPGPRPPPGDLRVGTVRERPQKAPPHLCRCPLSARSGLRTEQVRP